MALSLSSSSSVHEAQHQRNHTVPAPAIHRTIHNRTGVENEELDPIERGQDATSIDKRPLQQQEARRKKLLQHQLQQLEISGEALDQAALQSIQDPLSGYDGRFGKSAIRAYRSFLQPKSPQDDDNDPRLVAMAHRTAQQINFLLKRHAAHEQEWIRHHDPANPTTTTTSSSTHQNATTDQTTNNKFPIVLILDNLRSAMNVGSLFRTADATACQAVWTIGITPHPHGNGAEKLRKSALGAERIVPSQHFVTLQQALNHLRNQTTTKSTSLEGEEKESAKGNVHTERVKYPLDPTVQYKVVALETTQHSVDYTSVQYLTMSGSTDNTKNMKQGVALVLGNEVTGVTPSLLSEMDALVEIPTYGVKNSLNVAACAPIVLYEILRQWKVQQKEEEYANQETSNFT